MNVKKKPNSKMSWALIKLFMNYFKTEVKVALSLNLKNSLSFDTNFIRFGITPLYTQYKDLLVLVNTLKTIMNTERYLNFSTEKTTVT